MSRGGIATLIIGATLATGCLAPAAPHYSQATKQASFAPFRDAWVDGVPFESLIRRRSAVILGRPKMLSWSRPEGRSGGTLSYQTSDESCLGTAVALTRDGYLLTARHCVDVQPIHALIRTYAGVRPVKARVVWRGRDVDLALLKVEARLRNAFDWSDKLPDDGERLAVAGAFPQRDVFLAMAGGRALALGPQRLGGQGDPPHHVLRHDAPVHAGDSGGPVVDRFGRLLGINVRVSFRPDFSELYLSGRWSSEAILPSPARIRDLIAADRSIQHPYHAGRWTQEPSPR